MRATLQTGLQAGACRPGHGQGTLDLPALAVGLRTCLGPPEFGMGLNRTTASPSRCGIPRPVLSHLGSSLTINSSGNLHVSCSTAWMPMRVPVLCYTLSVQEPGSGIPY